MNFSMFVHYCFRDFILDQRSYVLFQFWNSANFLTFKLNLVQAPIFWIFPYFAKFFQHKLTERLRPKIFAICLDEIENLVYKMGRVYFLFGDFRSFSSRLIFSTMHAALMITKRHVLISCFKYCDLSKNVVLKVL